MIFHRFYPLIGITLLTSLFTIAQNKGLRPYTLEDGLPQSQVYDIIQDDIGYLWLGTRGGGICRFNGEEFQIWNEENGLLSNYIHSLHFANDSLFIGTRKGLSIKYKDKFSNLEGLQVNSFFRFNGKTYCATNVGLHVYNPKKGLIKLNLNPKINTSIVNDIVYDGKLFWVTTNKGLWKLSELKENAEIIVRHSAFDFTAALYHKEKVYAAAFGKGILVLNTNAKSYGNVWIEKLDRVNHIAVQNEDLWFSTDNEGIYVIKRSNNRLKQKINRKSGLGVSNINKTLTDRQSNIWIATSGGGFYKYFQNDFIHYDQETGLKGNRVYAVHHKDGEIWASNSEAGLIRIDEEGIAQIPQEKRLQDTKIKAITSDEAGNIWAGTDGKGILLKKLILTDSIIIDSTDVNNLKETIVQKTSYENYIINKKRGLVSDWIRSLYIDGNTIWAASYSSGITRFTYDFERNKVTQVKRFTKKNGIKDLEISQIKPDIYGTLWYVTQNGAIGYIKNNKVKHLSNILKQKIAINTILFKDDDLYLGTAGNGVWWANSTKDLKFEKLSGAKELYSNNVYQLIFDSEENLWVGSEKGVDKVKINVLNQIEDVYHYGRNDGFLGIETCLNAVDKDDEGHLWFGAIYGLTKYQPTDIKKATGKPEVHFENIEIAYKSLDSINITDWVKAEKTLNLNPQQTEISFSYKTVDLDHPEDIEYRYRLNGTAWSPWSSDHKQNLAGLAYGPHSFTAQSRDYRWQESEPIQFNFFIDSPIYQKLWFQLTLLALVLCAAAFLVWRYIQKVKNKNNEERERLKMQNHLLSLEHKALRLQMNPHFIFNVLNGIKAMGTSNPQKMNTTINTFATLLREILYNSRKDTISLDQEIKTIKHYIEVEQLMASKPFTYTISIDSDLEPEEILIPPMLVQPFVENAIRHGILKNNNEGKLKILFHTTEDFLHCEILDNGMGIFQSQKTKSKTDHQSMALTVTRERVESISGEGSLEISEIHHEDQSVAGTKIGFKIPLETDY